MDDSFSHLAQHLLISKREYSKSESRVSYKDNVSYDQCEHHAYVLCVATSQSSHCLRECNNIFLFENPTKENWLAHHFLKPVYKQLAHREEECRGEKISGEANWKLQLQKHGQPARGCPAFITHLDFDI